MFRFSNENWLIISVLTIWLSTQTSLVFSADNMTANQSISYSNNEITINNTIKYTGSIYAFAMSIFLPKNVFFMAFDTNSQPVIQPNVGDTGTVEFVWIKPPESPFHLKYSVKSSTTKGIIQSRVTYRKMKGEIHYNLPDVHIASAHGLNISR